MNDVTLPSAVEAQPIADVVLAFFRGKGLGAGLDGIENHRGWA